MIDLAQPERNDWLLEVGSNDGTIQRYLAGRGWNLVAIDPSAAKFAHEYPPESKLVVDFFSAPAIEAVSGGNKFKAIISIAMFYDLEEPLDFMKSVRNLLHKDGIWCCEQAYLPAMFDSLCYDTICHEHLTYFSLRQFEWMARHAGLRLIDVKMNIINGGSFTVFACRDDAPLGRQVSPNIGHRLALEERNRLHNADPWTKFSRRVHMHRARVRGFFEDARAAGHTVIGLGASTKGNVVLQYAGINKDLMTAIGERDPRKVGLRTPRTGIPIIAEDEARKLKPDFFFVGPWHFRDEITSRESNFLRGGGRIVFPLPQFETVRGAVSTPASTAARASGPAIQWAQPKLFGSERLLIAEALDSTMISGGHFVDAFEARLAEMHGSPLPAISTSNGTTALHLAYLALRIQPGDEIIVPGFGFQAAANMALALGANPVFADVDPRSWLIDPDDVTAKIGPRTKAIVAIHTYGNICDLSKLSEIARARGVALIEDCAESLGSSLAGQGCGTIGDIATFSFQATKTVTCGEGGAILCRSAEVAERARLIRNHGMKGRKRYWHHEIGHNFRLTNLQCAMLCAQLDHWTDIVTAQARLAEAYRLRLSGIPGISFQHFGSNQRPVIWATALRLDRADAVLRDALLERALESGIECRPGFYPASEQPIYRAPRLKHSEAIARQVIVPPIDTGLTEEELDRICQTLTSSLRELKYV
ncbi:MAG: aminotransferase class V-fold PLP-dependent enzyme [Rhodospirillaceae bacterium]|nr:aminotransferase class V-fold PLP-dependent enzyme [Rhodospirillaceae bacterium]